LKNRFKRITSFGSEIKEGNGEGEGNEEDDKGREVFKIFCYFYVF
jgi:hypothetical protein